MSKTDRLISEMYETQSIKKDTIQKYNRDMLESKKTMQRILHELGAEVDILKCPKVALGLTSRARLLHTNIKHAETREEKDKLRRLFPTHIREYLELRVKNKGAK